MDSDDASMLIYNISQNDEEVAEIIYPKLNEEDKKTIKHLNSYEEDVAGAYMQNEAFLKFHLDENI